MTTKRSITIMVPPDKRSEWEFRSTSDGETRTFDIIVDISARDYLYDQNGRRAQTQVYVQVIEKGVESPSFISTRGTLRINRLSDGTAHDYEATLDFGSLDLIGKTAIIGKTEKGTAEAFASAVAENFLAQMRRDRKAHAERTVYTAAY